MATDTSTVWLVKLSDRANVAVALGLAGACAYTAARLLAPGEPLAEPEPVEASDIFSAEEIAVGRAYARPQQALGLARSALELAATAGLVSLISRQPDANSSYIFRRRATSASTEALQAGVTGAGLALGTTALGLPLSAISRRRSLTAGLATDAWSSWVSDLVKSTVIEATLTGVLLAGSSALASRTQERWWLYASGAVVAVGVAAGTLGPILLDPVFNTFDPLPDGETRSDVLGLAAAAGVNVGEVYSVDASRRTSAVNAYVNGLGPSKRVVLFDTLLADYGREEVRFVVAHELGHVYHRDVPRQIVFLALCAPSLTFTLQTLTGAMAGQMTGARAVPALTLAGWAVGAPLILAGAALSRAVEARTDQFGLTLSDAPEGLISFFRKIAIQNRADVTAGRLTRHLLASHPPITERIGAARTYQRATAAGRRPRTPAGS